MQQSPWREAVMCMKMRHQEDVQFSVICLRKQRAQTIMDKLLGKHLRDADKGHQHGSVSAVPHLTSE